MKKRISYKKPAKISVKKIPKVRIATPKQSNRTKVINRFGKGLSIKNPSIPSFKIK